MTDALAWALVHFLWQGAALAGVAWILMRLTSSPSARYVIGVTTMGAMVIAVVVTAVSSVPPPTPPAVAQVQADSVRATQGDADADSAALASVPRVFPSSWILAFWATGVIVLSGRLVGGWWVARRVAHTALLPLTDPVQAIAAGLALRLGLRRTVRVGQSARVAVPVLIGWLRPVVLIPPAAVAGLSLQQLEAILAHEFAHIRRHDYLVNLCQSVVETALFFHPAVWWLSRQIRRERECCCDDLAVQVCDRLTYATALSALAHRRIPAPALAATDGSLRDRIRRIATTSPSSESAKGGWMAVFPLLLVVTLAVPSAYSQVTVRPIEAPPATPVTAVVTVTAPQKAEPVTIAVPMRAVAPVVIERRSVPTTRVEPVQRGVEQAGIERDRAAAERDRAQHEAEAILLQRQVELISAEQSLARLKELVDKGLATRAQLEGAELTVAVANSRLVLARANAASQQETRQRRELAFEVQPERNELRRAVEVSTGTALAADAALQPGDLVRIVIAGEPDLPTTYVVQPGGTVRLPLLGSLTVQGLTVTDARAAVEQLLSSKNITGVRVTVSATRR